MKPSLIVAVATGLLSVGAGVAIAGVPTTPAGDGLVITAVPTTTSTTIPIVPDTVAPLPTTTTTTTLAVTTSSGQNLTPTTLPQPRPLVDRGELAVVTANGAGVAGIAGSTAEALLADGYVTVEAVDAPAVVEQSIVYHPADLAAEAIRLAGDLGWGIGNIAPIDAAPELVTTVEADLVAVIGTDQVATDDAPATDEP